MDIIATAHKLTYQQNVMLAVQQTTSRFEAGFTYHPDLRGRLACMLELMGDAAAIVDGNRGGDTPNIDSNIEPVWIVPRQVEWGKLIEKEDAIKALTDYQSPFVQVGAKAIVRSRDVIFATSIFADRKIGQDGGTTSSYDNTSKQVAVGVGSGDGVSATGMNVAKLVRARRFLQAFYVDIDSEDIHAVVNAQGMEELYGDITYIDKDYRDSAVLEGKQVKRILDITIHQYEGMTDFDANTYTGAVWAKSGMHYGDFEPLSTRAEPNPAKKYRIHPFMENWFGATRSEDKKVVKLLNKK